MHAKAARRSRTITPRRRADAASRTRLRLASHPWSCSLHERAHRNLFTLVVLKILHCSRLSTDCRNYVTRSDFGANHGSRARREPCIGHTRCEHNAGHSPHTSEHGPWKRLVVIEFDEEKPAIDVERYLKIGSGREFARQHFRQTMRD